MKPTFFLLLGALFLNACAEQAEAPLAGRPVLAETPPPSATTFDARDFAWSLGRGTGSISGSLGYHQGATRFGCQGGDVLLTPETAWSRRRMIILYGSASAAAAPVSIVRARTPSAGAGDYARFVRRTTCDASNHFSFDGLPDGAWFLITVGRPLDGSGEPVAVTRRVETHGGAVGVMLS